MTTHHNTTSDRDGVQSTGRAPTEYLNRVATTLRNPPNSPISTVKDFTKSLGVKLIRRNRHALLEVTAWLEKNLDHGKVDHYMPMTLETEDILILIQPYDHPDLTEGLSERGILTDRTAKRSENMRRFADSRRRVKRWTTCKGL